MNQGYMNQQQQYQNNSIQLDMRLEHRLCDVLSVFCRKTNTTSEMLESARKELDEIKKSNPQFVLYMASIHGKNYEKRDTVMESIRQLAGIKLQHLVREEVFQPNYLEFIKQNVMNALLSGINSVMNMAGAVISKIIKKNGIEAWPTILRELNQLLMAPNRLPGPLSCLTAITTENLEQYIVKNKVAELIDLVLSTTNLPNLTVEEACEVADCLKALVKGAKSIWRNDPGLMDTLLNRTFFFVSKEVPELNITCCQIFNMLLPGIPDNAIQPIFKFLLDVVGSGHERSGLQACEVLLLVFGKDQNAQIREKLFLSGFLEPLINVLVPRMVFDNLTLQLIQEDTEIHPRLMNHHPELHGAQQGEKTYYNDYNEEEHDDDDDDDDDDDYDLLQNWSLSKCAQQTYQKVVAYFPEPAFNISLNHIMQSLNSPKWEIVYCGVFMVGSFAKFIDRMPKLAQPLNAVIQIFYTEHHALVLMNASWVIAEYCHFLVEQQYFDSIMGRLIDLMAHPVHRVQTGACSAITTIGETISKRVLGYFEKICEKIQWALVNYSKKVLLQLYDLIDMLIDLLGEDVKSPNVLNLILHPLIDHGKNLKNSSNNSMHYFYLMKNVVKAVGEHILPFSKEIYLRAMDCIWTKIKEYKNASKKTSLDSSPLTVALLCVNEIFGALSFQPALDDIINSIPQPDHSFYNALFSCMEHEDGPVRQTVFGIIGDLAKFRVPSFSRINPDHYLQVLIRVLDHIVNISTSQPTVASNAAWAIGEIALLIGSNIEAYIQDILKFLVPIMNSDKALPNLRENCAITIGRLARVNSHIVVSQFSVFIQSYCILIQKAKDRTERDQAYEGLLSMLSMNPNFNDSISFIIVALVKYGDGDLTEPTKQCLVAIRKMFNQQEWQMYISSHDQATKVVLQNL